MSKKGLTYFVIVFTLLTFLSIFIKGGNKVAFSLSETNIEQFYTLSYEKLGSEVPKPNIEVYKRALTGFFNLKLEHKIKNNLLTIIDFSLSSKEKRMWVIDMCKMEVVHHSLVAHGVNTGEEFAKSFSNRPSSNQSSLGFYVTDMTYIGKHGRSLYLDGVEQGVNDKARERTIVMHCANYVSEDFIRRNGRLGRSFGCPAIPMKDHEKIITLLAGGSCIYIHYPDEQYLSNSKLLAQEKTVAGLYALFSETLSAYNFYPELCSTADNP